MKPLISIIIPIYNQASKLGDCLQSIMSQNYTDWEVIVVNDGSTDAIDQVIKDWQQKFPSEKFSYFSKENEGSNPTRNFGAEKAKGDFLLFCDADLTLNSQMLEKMQRVLTTHPEISFVYCSFYYGSKLFKLFPYDEDRLRRMPYIHTTSLLRREHFPGFDNSIRRLQDWDLWLTMLKQGHIGFWINEPLFKVKTSGHISTWVPRITYKILPFLPAVKKYKTSVAHIKNKHDLA
jgi:glycosyltransferase involved in cell wall biosynthesis